jgi:hypothetical protein
MRRACQSPRCDTALTALEDRDNRALYHIPELFLTTVVLIHQRLIGTGRQRL